MEIQMKRSNYLHEGIRQAGMLVFSFAAACKREKLAKRVSHRFRITCKRVAEDIKNLLVYQCLLIHLNL